MIFVLKDGKVGFNIRGGNEIRASLRKEIVIFSNIRIVYKRREECIF
jgi:hypothetical protein